jgi:hypothetical protein
MPSFRTAGNTFAYQQLAGERSMPRGNNTGGGHSGFRDVRADLYHMPVPFLLGDWQFEGGLPWPTTANSLYPISADERQLYTPTDWRDPQLFDTEPYPDPPAPPTGTGRGWYLSSKGGWW